MGKWKCTWCRDNIDHHAKPCKLKAKYAEFDPRFCPFDNKSSNAEWKLQEDAGLCYAESAGYQKALEKLEEFDEGEINNGIKKENRNYNHNRKTSRINMYRAP